MTGQDVFDSYEAINLGVAVDLVNRLAVEHAFGRPVEPVAADAALREVLAYHPPSVARLRRRDVPDLVALAASLREIFAALDAGDVDGAADRLNALLAAHPAYPHLAKDGGRWRLHPHPVDASLVAEVNAICADSLARVVGAGAAERLGTCGADECDRVFYDESKNASRRFCSTTCQNRVKAAAFRRRARDA